MTFSIPGKTVNCFKIKIENFREDISVVLPLFWAKI